MAKAEPSEEPLENHPKYEKVRHLSAGAFGFVQLARNRKSGKDFAIKFLERGRTIDKHVAREIIHHSKLCHPHVVQFKEAFLTERYLGIAMEYAPGGDLFTYVKRKGCLPEADARWFFQQLIIAVDYCHRMGVVNRDIKLENTMLEKFHNRALVKMIDFGYCKSHEESLPKTPVGTPGYTAPEVLISNGSYDGQKADVWSCGVMLYVMLFCKYPFGPYNGEVGIHGFRKVHQRILRVEYEIPTECQVSGEVVDLLRRIFVVDPKERLSVQQIQAHPWFLVGLPNSVSSMNDTCVKINPHKYKEYQTIPQIHRILLEASRSVERQLDQTDRQTSVQSVATAAGDVHTGGRIQGADTPQEAPSSQGSWFSNFPVFGQSSRSGEVLV